MRGKMKTKALVTLLLIIPLISFWNACPGETAEENIVLPEIPRITVEELKQMIEKGEAVITVDTRDSGSYAAGHIKGAVNIYYDPTSDPMQRQMMLIALPMDKLIVTYCDCTDDESSAKMADELYRLGYDRDKIKVLSGGSLRWVELKYPLEKLQ
jgi:rhodanese-related sulfurtransferase